MVTLSRGLISTLSSSYASFLKIWPLFFLGLTVQAFAQQQANKSHFAPGDITCSELYSYTSEILDSSLFFKDGSNKVIEDYLSQDRLKDCEAYSFALTIFGFQQYINGDILSSRNSLIDADLMYKKDKSISRQQFIRNNIFLALNYGVDHDSLQSLQYLNVAEIMSREINHKALLADVLSNKALVYLNSNQISKAKSTFDKSIKYCLETGNEEILAFAYLNYGRIFRYEKKYDEAFEIVTKAEALFRSRNQSRNLYIVEVSRGEIYIELDDEKNAIDRFELASKLGDETNHKFLHGLIYKSLGSLYKKINKKKSIEYFELAFKNSTQLNDSEYADVTDALTSHYLQTKDHQKFYSMFNEMSTIYDTRKRLLNVELSESNKRQILIEKEKNENEILRIKNTEARRTTYLGFIFALIFLMLAYYAYRQLLKNKVLSEQVNEQNKRLEEQNIELKNFAYMASHDLKAPARSISSFVGLLKKRISTKEDERIFSYIDVIEKSASNMHQLVSSLLEFSNIENAKTEFIQIESRALFEDVLNNLYSLIEAKNASIILPDQLPKYITGDESKLKIVFQNLINNAIKFVPSQRMPKVIIKYTDDGINHRFSITDNGIGMERKYLDKIFLMFQRLNASSEFDGSGIGLSMCKKIILLHKGKIDVKSIKGDGSTFYVQWPKDLS